MIWILFLIQSIASASDQTAISMDQLSGEDRSNMQGQLDHLIETHPDWNPTQCKLIFIKSVLLKQSAPKQQVIEELQKKKILYFDLKEKMVDVVAEAQAERSGNIEKHFTNEPTFRLTEKQIRRKALATGQVPLYDLIFLKYLVISPDKAKDIIQEVNPELKANDIFFVDQDNLQSQELYDFLAGYNPDLSQEKIMSKLQGAIEDANTEKNGNNIFTRPLTKDERYQQHVIRYSIAAWHCASAVKTARAPKSPTKYDLRSLVTSPKSKISTYHQNKADKKTLHETKCYFKAETI